MNKSTENKVFLSEDEESKNCVLEYAEHKINMYKDGDHQSVYYVFSKQKTLQLLVSGNGVKLLIPLNSVFYLKGHRHVWRSESNSALPLKKWQFNLTSQGSGGFASKKNCKSRFSKIFCKTSVLYFPLLFCTCLCIFLSKKRSDSGGSKIQNSLGKFLTAANINTATKQNSLELPLGTEQHTIQSHTKCFSKNFSKCVPRPPATPSQKRDHQTTNSNLD